MDSNKTAVSLKDTYPQTMAIQIHPVQTTPFTLQIKLKMRLWNVIQATVFRWSPILLRGFRRGLLRWFGAQVATTASIHNTARIDCPWNLTIGPYASIGEQAWVYALDQIVIGEYATVGQQVRLITGTHDITDPTFTLITKPIVIGYGCWLATGVTVLPGVKIGALAVIGSGAVVTKDISEQSVCAGNPCQFIKKRVFKESIQHDIRTHSH